jgi:hypothetical protein
MPRLRMPRLRRWACAHLQEALQNRLCRGALAKASCKVSFIHHHAKEPMTEPQGLFSTPVAAPFMALIHSQSTAMKRHRVFGLIQTVEDLQTFMSWHAFAVWDFMSLVKRIQIEFTSTQLPWVPPRNPQAARLINEIVLGEETDVAVGGGHLSHYELYLAAMKEVGADATQVQTFTDLVSNHIPVAQALQQSGAPAAVAEFVTSTIQLATKGSIEQVLGSFVFGREDAIPEMFKNLLGMWGMNEKTAPMFVYYLQRHIELDGDEHGPAAMRMLENQINGNAAQLVVLLKAAIEALAQRIKLWDALAKALERKKSPALS